ncbi:hypothetical protein P4B35_03075 [Pontiellaceae bacterium B12227]|nr:hypothetical protein [Pontiellaceae bacterium B12227]
MGERIMPTPSVTQFNQSDLEHKSNRLLIISEGFESRSLSFLSALQNEKLFEHSIVVKNAPERKNRLEELLKEVQPRTNKKAKEAEYDRFHPTKFEEMLGEILKPIEDSLEEVVIDISVMSKMLIMSLLWRLQSIKCPVRIIYTEPMSYCPSEDEFAKQRKDFSNIGLSPSFGVHDVVRTPELSSVIMQRSPAYVIAFNSFNEQLIHALLATINPAHLIMIGCKPPHLSWREKAAQEIHADVINDFSSDNPLKEDGLLKRTSSALDYRETIACLSEIYNKICFTHRMVLAPTGSKMQALGCALFKICCPDVHIEYPTPESYLLTGFSSDEIRTIHQVYLDSVAETCWSVSAKFELNG